MDIKPAPAAAYWPDIIAGLSIAGLLLPEAIAYSSIANLPPQAGIIALFAGLLCYGLLGTSRFAIVSATSSSAAVLAAASASVAGGDSGLRLTLAIGLVLVTGLCFLIASLARLGSLTDFIAKPVLRGFAFGLAAIIVLKQVASMLGIHLHHSDIIGLLADLARQASSSNPVGLAIGCVALALLFALGRYRQIPGALIVIGLGIAASQWLNITAYGVNTVGAIHLQLDTPSLPALSKTEWLRLGELGFAMVMVLYSESYGSIRSFAMQHGDPVSPNRDLLALGAANLVSGLFHGMPVGAGYSGTSANAAAGANSRLASGVAAVVLMLIVLTMLPGISLTPEPVLAAIVIHAVSHALNPAVFRPYFVWRRDRLLALAAIVSVLILGVLDGLLVAIGISLIMLLQRFSESTVTVLGRLGESHNFVDIGVHPEARPIPGILILRPEEQIFFANVERILGQSRQTVIESGPAIHTVILSLEETADLDSSSLEALNDFFKAIASQQKHLLLARLKHPVHEVLKELVPPGSGPLMSGLSVDDAVQMAMPPQISHPNSKT